MRSVRFLQIRLMGCAFHRHQEFFSAASPFDLQTLRILLAANPLPREVGTA